jgi:hypothetical protein
MLLWYTILLPYIHIQCHLTTRPLETLRPTPAQSPKQLYHKKITQGTIKPCFLEYTSVCSPIHFRVHVRAKSTHSIRRCSNALRSVDKTWDTTWKHTTTDQLSFIMHAECGYTRLLVDQFFSTFCLLPVHHPIVQSQHILCPTYHASSMWTPRARAPRINWKGLPRLFCSCVFVLCGRGWSDA